MSMIKLCDLLEEIKKQPKAIFLSGAAGSGKSYISKQLIPDNFIRINIDDSYEELLNKNGLGTKQKDFNPEELSKAASLQQQAKKITQDKLNQSSQERKNLLIDGTGGSSKVLLNKKQELENLGYKTFMLMLYVTPLTSLERNKQRDRSLMPSIVLRTWRDVYNNINTYKQAFENNFVLLNNNPKESNNSFSEELIEPYFKDSLAKGKPKTPGEMRRKEDEEKELKQDIENLLKQPIKFNPLVGVKQKLNSFINGR